MSEKLHRRIYRESGGSYAQIARKLYLDNGKLVRSLFAFHSLFAFLRRGHVAPMTSSKSEFLLIELLTRLEIVTSASFRMYLLIQYDIFKMRNSRI